MGVATNAAIATLTVSKTLYENDKLLQWVCHLASPFQLTVKQENSKTPLLQLELQNTTLTMRNTILRTLCGMGLHNALDQAPYYLMGGGGGSICSAAGPLAKGLLMQWMSTADSLRNKTETIETVLPALEELLAAKSFVIGSAQATLADFDLALVLCEGGDEEEQNALDAAAYPNVARWIETVLWAFAATAPPEISKPAMKLFGNDTKKSTMMSDEPLVFFDGTEDVNAILAPPAAAATTKAAEPSQKAAGAAAGNNQQGSGKKKGKGGGGGEQPPQGKKKGGGGEKQQQQQQAVAAADAGFTIAAMDIRVGKIVKAWHHENSDKLFCEDVDIGTDTPRQVASGLRQFYKTEDLRDRLVLVVCNLKARPLGGFPSHGMVLCASNADHTAVEFVVPPEDSKPGDRIVFEGYESGEPEPENKVNKKKIFEKVAPDLKTDDKGNVVWKTALAKTEAGGVVRALNGMPNASVS